MDGDQKANFEQFYDKNYKKLLIIPFLVLAIALILLVVNHTQTGSFINKGISLQGGTSISIISSSLSVEEIKELINYDGQIKTRTMSSAGKQVGVIIEIDSIEEQVVQDLKNRIINGYNLNEEDVAVESIGSSLGSSFFQETIRAVIFAFIFMGIVVFLYFRTVVPSLAIILAAASDIIITLAITNLLGISLSTAGIAAFLMLIGYSVDTDILLSTKVLKRKEGTVNQRMLSALKTGMMMSLTTITAIIIALIFSQSETITQIMTIILIGLIVDLMNTWIQNAGILKMYWNMKK